MASKKFPPTSPNLQRYFDEMVEAMQSPEAARAVDRFFSMTPLEMGDAALRGAQREFSQESPKGESPAH